MGSSPHMIPRSLALFLPSLFAVILFTACGGEESISDSPQFPLVSLGNASLKLELALTKSEQRTGLMHREGIAENHGMLFIYDQPTRMSYWMKNVDFPIDIGFLTADGILREVYPMYANDTGSRKSRRSDLSYALEVSRGWYKRNGVKLGDQLDLEAVNKAIADKLNR